MRTAALRTGVTTCLAACCSLPVVARAQTFESAWEIVRHAVSDGSIPGASVLIMQHGKVLEHRAFGVCEISPRRPFQTDTICWIASLTKPVTATAAMLQVEQGRLRLDEPIASYLPNLSRLETKDGQTQSVTVRQLMSHSSGIPASVPLREPYFFTQAWYDRSLQEVVEAIAQRPLDFQPGSRTHYSNAAPYVLGRIIEVTSGQPFADFVNSEILAPLHMQDTGFSIPEHKTSRAAVVYRREREDLKVYCRYDPTWRVKMSMPDGGLFSTPLDIARFANSFLNSERPLIGRDLVDEMLTQQSQGYGLGWILDRPHQFSHWGSSGTLVWADKHTGIVGVFFSQIQDFDLLARLRNQVRDAVDAVIEDEEK